MSYKKRREYHVRAQIYKPINKIHPYSRVKIGRTASNGGAVPVHVTETSTAAPLAHARHTRERGDKDARRAESGRSAAGTYDGIVQVARANGQDRGASRERDGSVSSSFWLPWRGELPRPVGQGALVVLAVPPWNLGPRPAGQRRRRPLTAPKVPTRAAPRRFVASRRRRGSLTE